MRDRGCVVTGRGLGAVNGKFIKVVIRQFWAKTFLKEHCGPTSEGCCRRLDDVTLWCMEIMVFTQRDITDPRLVAHVT